MSLRRAHADAFSRMRLRISCRPGSWLSGYFGDFQLRAAGHGRYAGSQHGRVLRLAPLRQRDTELAANAHGIDGGRFVRTSRRWLSNLLPRTRRPCCCWSDRPKANSPCRPPGAKRIDGALKRCFPPGWAIEPQSQGAACMDSDANVRRFPRPLICPCGPAKRLGPGTLPCQYRRYTQKNVRPGLTSPMRAVHS